MVSEEPKPEIYNQPGAKIDIWLAHFGIHFKPEVALDRLQNHDEETWIYWLYNTYLPRFNPFTIDHPGVEGKLTAGSCGNIGCAASRTIASMIGGLTPG